MNVNKNGAGYYSIVIMAWDIYGAVMLMAHQILDGAVIVFPAYTVGKYREVHYYNDLFIYFVAFCSIWNCVAALVQCHPFMLKRLTLKRLTTESLLAAVRHSSQLPPFFAIRRLLPFQ